MKKFWAVLIIGSNLLLGTVVGAILGGMVGWVLSDPQDRHGVAILVGSWAGMGLGAFVFGCIGVWRAIRHLRRTRTDQTASGETPL